MRNSKVGLLKALAVTLFVLAFVSLNYLWKQHSPNRDDAKLKELQRVSTEIPVFPSFSEVATHESSRAIDAGVYKYYSSPAKYSDAKQFYITELGNIGWKLANEEYGRRLDFKKDDFRISIEYAGDNANRSWNYAINFVWDNK